MTERQVGRIFTGCESWECGVCVLPEGERRHPEQVLFRCGRESRAVRQKSRRAFRRREVAGWTGLKKDGPGPWPRAAKRPAFAVTGQAPAGRQAARRDR